MFDTQSRQVSAFFYRYGNLLSWVIVFLVGPVLVYLTAAFHLQNAPISPILPFFILIFFLPPWQAGVGFLVAISYSTYQLFIKQNEVHLDLVIRLLVLLFFFGLIVVTKLNLRTAAQQHVKLVKEQAQLNLFKHLVEHSPYAILVEDYNGVVLIANDAAEKLFGYAQEDFVGYSMDLITPARIFDERLALRHELFRQNGSKIEHTLRDMLLRRSDGVEFFADIHVTTVPWKGGVVLRITIIDLTERKTLEAEQRKTADLEETVRVRDRFLSTAAHELKTPIASIVLYSDILETNFNGTLSAVADLKKVFLSQKELTEKSIKAIQHQAYNISLLVNQFLDISAIGNGSAMSIFPQVILVCPLLEQVRELAQLQTTRHKIVVSCEAGLMGYVDRLRLEQIMVNLLNNSIKYSPDGGNVQVSARSTAEGGIEISVRDYGLGIPLEKREHIFTRFYRAHETFAPSGLGLGLFLSREIITAHGGTISFADPPDDEGGIVFTVVVPAQVVK